MAGVSGTAPTVSVKLSRTFLRTLIHPLAPLWTQEVVLKHQALLKKCMEYVSCAQWTELIFLLMKRTHLSENPAWLTAFPWDESRTCMSWCAQMSHLDITHQQANRTIMAHEVTLRRPLWTGVPASKKLMFLPKWWVRQWGQLGYFQWQNKVEQASFQGFCNLSKNLRRNWDIESLSLWEETWF